MVFGRKKTKPAAAPAPVAAPPVQASAASTSAGAPRRTAQSPAMDAARKFTRESERVVQRGRRDMQRERMRLEAEERKLMVEIKALGKQGRMGEARLLAKNLVQIRVAKERTFQASSQMSAMANQAKMTQANTKMIEVMQSTTEVMQNAGRIADPARQRNVLMQYDMETEKNKLNQEMTDEVFDSILGGDEIDTGTDEVLNGVLDEIGLEVAASTADQTPSIRPQEQKPIEEQLANSKDTEELFERIARIGGS